MDAHIPTPTLRGLGRVHLVGIGGAGMSAVARLLLARDVPVSGSDARESAVLDQLRVLGASIDIGHDAAHVAGADTVVVSTAIRADNPELSAAREQGSLVLHRSQALAAAMAGKRLVAVAGTHGKTTTTAMVTVMLQSAGLAPSFAIGGNVAALGVNAAQDTGDIFVAEADESDGSFLNYEPSIAVVTNVEADHLDHYGTADAVHESFDRFVRLLPPDGLLIACADDPGSAALARRASRGEHPPRILTYGTSAEADLRVRFGDAAGQGSDSTLTAATHQAAPATSAAIQAGGGAAPREQPLHLQVPGAHNVLNAAAAFGAGVDLGLAPEAAAAGLAVFTGAARRFEAKGTVGGVRVFDDYAHHPTEVAAALRAARTVAGGHRVHVLFQPHLFSRTRAFASEFAAALALADDVAVIDIYPAREEPIPGVTSELVTTAMDADGAAGTYFTDPTAACASLTAATVDGDIILTVGAGDVTGYGSVLLEHLSIVHGATAPSADPTASAGPTARDDS